MIGALVAGGARLDFRAARAGAGLAAAVMLDQIELLRRAVEDGWDGRTVPGSSWAPLALARLATAGRVAALLAERTASAPPVPQLAAGDTPPVRLSGASPADPRVEDVLFPKVQVIITAIVEPDGTLSHVLAGTPHDRLRAATLAAVRGWRFKPGERDGRPLALAIQFPVQFPERDNRLHSLNDVDRQPELHRSGPLLEELAQRLASGGAYLHAHSRVGMIVEKDGSTSRVTLPELLPPDYADLIHRVASGAKFKPALRQGQPVRAWIDLDIGYDLKITHVVDESHRFNLEPPEN
jgi:protein TonB